MGYDLSDNEDDDSNLQPVSAQRLWSFILFPLCS